MPTGVKKRINQRIRYNRRISIDEIASAMRISHGNEYSKNGCRPEPKYEGRL